MFGLTETQILWIVIFVLVLIVTTKSMTFAVS
jgi:hypothetical protein